jgi:two-component system, chemotaxis family, CheB/CheR fusion protein
VNTKKPSQITKQTSPTPTESAAYPAITIVGIGASAGGLEAFEQFFGHMPADSGLAFVLIPHLDPSHASLLTEILQRAIGMPVHEALDQIPVEANHVYVIPPNRDMAVFHGVLQLTVPEQPRGQRLPIDGFLRSLAEDRQEHAIGIILSGTGFDGTLGCRAILGSGGLTLVQDPATAKYDGMPASAIKAGYASQVLPVDKMPRALLKLAHSHFSHPLEPLAPKTAHGINSILMQLRTLTGHDFSLYKKSTLNRRIERRMLQHAIEDTGVYARFLKENPDEVRALFHELLINVTNFFRDPEAFAVLEQEILPQLCQDKPDNYLLRVWVPGCATGEEAYSIAILLYELMEKSHQPFKVQIYSTDLDDTAIDMARAGVYPPNIAQDVTPVRLQRFFDKEGAGYRIKKEIREMLVFAVQDIIKDPPFTKLDLLSCRNLMIYLEPELQNRLIPAFHYALKPGGVLFLSPSEGIGNHTGLFSALNPKWKIYRAPPSVTQAHTAMPQGLAWTEGSGIKAPGSVMTKPKVTNFAELSSRALLQFFAPAAVITDFKGDILYVHGETGKYLRPAPGQAGFNAIEMAREGLPLELRAAIHACVAKGKPTLGRELEVKTNGGFTAVSLDVRPLSGTDGGQGLLLVSFQDIARPTGKPLPKRSSSPAERSRIEALEHELAYLKENYQASIEEQQVSNEELKSTNEEMQSTNEELQSSNEEMETAKEELQSVNEELITVNSELQAKIEELVGLQNDNKNLLDNINVGVIFLDQQLKIRSFTRDAVRVFRLAASDVGRNLGDIRPSIDKDLLPAAQAVLDTLVPHEQELEMGNNNWMLARIQPYRTLDNIIDGVVLSFTDITARVKAIATQEALLLAEGIVSSIHEPFVVLNKELEVISASAPFYREFHLTPEGVLGTRIYGLGNRQWDIPDLHTLLESVLHEVLTIDKHSLEYDFGDGHRHILLSARRITGKVGENQMILLTMELIP